MRGRDALRGGQYWLYKYRRYADVRLVFTPEHAIASFGGDPDNFQFPRWDLDMALLRAYAGEPADTPNHFAIDFAGPKAGQPVFVAGHPGPTDRELTVAQLKTLRDLDLPSVAAALFRAARPLHPVRKDEPLGRADRAAEGCSTVENSIKVRRKLLDTLLDDRLMRRKRDDEANAARVVRTPTRAPRRRSAGSAWIDIAKARDECATSTALRSVLEDAAGFNSRLFRYARELVRAATSGRNRTRSGCANTATPRCRRSSSTSAPPRRSIRSSKSSRCRSRSSGCASGSAPTIPSSGSCLRPSRPIRSRPRS